MPRAEGRRRAGARKIFVTGPPSSVFLRWVGVILFAVWAAWVVLYAPDLMRRFNDIRAIDTPGAAAAADAPQLACAASGPRRPARLG